MIMAWVLAAIPKTVELQFMVFTSLVLPVDLKADFFRIACDYAGCFNRRLPALVNKELRK